MKTAIVIVAYQGKKWLEGCLKSCQLYAPGVPVYVVDNASSDGSGELAAQFSAVTVLRQEINRGFAGGNNAGLSMALQAGAEAVFLLNQDAELTAGCCELLTDYLANNPQVAAVQPAIVLPDGKVNSLGNSFHWLGFAEAGGNGLTLDEARTELAWLKNKTEPPYVSGAAVLLRAEALWQIGFLYEELFMYHEDLELSLRLRVAGWHLAVMPQARVIHAYEPVRSRRQYYYMERNRFIVWCEIFQAPTVGLLLPFWLLSELILLPMSAVQGWFWQKLRTYGYFLRTGSWLRLLAARRRIRRLRRVTDNQLMSFATAYISYQSGPTVLLTKYCFNPLSALVWRILKPLIRW